MVGFPNEISAAARTIYTRFLFASEIYVRISLVYDIPVRDNVSDTL